MKFLFPILFFIQLNSFGQDEKPYYVGYSKNNIIYSNSLKIKQPVFKKNYIELDNGERHNIIDIKFYNDISGFHLKNNLTSTRKDFADRTVKGKIDIYEYYVSTYTSSGPYGGGYYSQRLVKAYDKGETYSLTKIKYQYLNVDLSDNERSMDVLHDVKVLRNVSAGLYLGGTVSFIYGLHKLSIGKNNSGSILMATGGVFFVVPWIMSFSKKSKLKQAINIYNE